MLYAFWKTWIAIILTIWCEFLKWDLALEFGSLIFITGFLFQFSIIHERKTHFPWTDGAKQHHGITHKAKRGESHTHSHTHTHTHTSKLHQMLLRKYGKFSLACPYDLSIDNIHLRYFTSHRSVQLHCMFLNTRTGEGGGILCPPPVFRK